MLAGLMRLMRLMLSMRLMLFMLLAAHTRPCPFFPASPSALAPGTRSLRSSLLSLAVLLSRVSREAFRLEEGGPAKSFMACAFVSFSPLSLGEGGPEMGEVLLSGAWL